MINLTPADVENLTAAQGRATACETQVNQHTALVQAWTVALNAERQGLRLTLTAIANAHGVAEIPPEGYRLEGTQLIPNIALTEG